MTIQVLLNWFEALETGFGDYLPIHYVFNLNYAYNNLIRYEFIKAKNINLLNSYPLWPIWSASQPRPW